MRVVRKTVSVLAAVLALVSPVTAATVTGTVTGADGQPFMGAFVIADDARTHRSVSVLTDQQGRYRIPDLPAALYSIRIRAIGYASDPQTNVQLAGNQTRSFDFRLRPAAVRWSDLTTWQGRQLLPKTATVDLARGGRTPSDPVFTTCMQSCHSFQTRMAATVRTEAGWRDRVKYMRDVIMSDEGPPMTEARFESIVSYLTTAFGPNSPKTASPADMPEYRNLVRSVSPNALNIVYVEYDVSGSRGWPWSAVEDKDGKIWVPYYGRGNGVGRLDPATAQVTKFILPSEKTAGVHSVIPSPDGTVWLTEFMDGKIARLNPATGEFDEYPHSTPAGRMAPHTVRVDHAGNIWTSGGRFIARFDLATKQFTTYDVGNTYGIEVDTKGDLWFTVFNNDGPIVRITRDGQVSKWLPPTKGKPQRLAFDSTGIVWFTERTGGNIGRFDPKTETFREFPLPGPNPSPYAIAVDRNDMIWYSSTEQDTLNRLDPKTGEVVEYPFPRSELKMRELFLDAKGRIWYANPSSNRVGYFYLAETPASPARQSN